MRGFNPAKRIVFGCPVTECIYEGEEGTECPTHHMKLLATLRRPKKPPTWLIIIKRKQRHSFLKDVLNDR